MKKARHNAPSARLYKRGRKNNSVQRVQKKPSSGINNACRKRLGKVSKDAISELGREEPEFRSWAQMRLGFRTDHVQSPKGRGSRKILGGGSETRAAEHSAFS